MITVIAIERNKSKIPQTEIYVNIDVSARIRFNMAEKIRQHIFAFFEPLLPFSEQKELMMSKTSVNHCLIMIICIGEKKR